MNKPVTPGPQPQEPEAPLQNPDISMPIAPVENPQIKIPVEEGEKDKEAPIR